MLALLLGALGLAGCAPFTTTNTTVHIDWVDFLRWEGRTYEGLFVPEEMVRSLTPGELLGHVRFKVSDNVSTAGYQPRDGDAAYLPAGTPIHAIEGYSQVFRVMVPVEGQGRYRIFQVTENPAAGRVEDLLDVRGRVRAVYVNESFSATYHLAALDSPAEVDRLVSGLLNQPLNTSEEREPEARAFFLELALTDGTSVTKALWTDPLHLFVTRGRTIPAENIPLLSALVVQAAREPLHEDMEVVWRRALDQPFDHVGVWREGRVEWVRESEGMLGTEVVAALKAVLSRGRFLGSLEGLPDLTVYGSPSVIVFRFAPDESRIALYAAILLDNYMEQMWVADNPEFTPVFGLRIHKRTLDERRILQEWADGLSVPGE